MKIFTIILAVILVVILVAYLGLVAFMYNKQRQFIYFPDERVPTISRAPWAEIITVTTADGLTLNSWWSAPRNNNKPTVVYFHGNAGNIEGRASKAEIFISQGYGVLLLEYRGYGGNPGDPTEAGLYQDARAHLDWLLQDKKIKPENLVLYGESLGSGVAVQMATEYDTKALILESPFFSILEMYKFRAPFIPFMEMLAKDPYRSDLKIGAIHTPVFIGVAEFDRVIPSRFGAKLFNAANEPKKYRNYRSARHMDIFNRGFARDVIDSIETAPAKK